MESSPVDAANDNHGNLGTTIQLQNVSHDIENPPLPQSEIPRLGNSNSDDHQQQQSPAEQSIVASRQSSIFQRLLSANTSLLDSCYYFTARQLQQPPEEDLSEALKAMTSTSKILVPSIALTMVGAIITGQLSPKIRGIPGHNRILSTEMGIQYIAILFMILGMYKQVRRKRLSMWLQCIGHLLSIDGFLIMGSSWLHFPLRLLPIPLLIIDIALLSFISM